MMVSEPWGISEGQIRSALQDVAERMGLQGGAVGPHELAHCFQTACSELLRVTTAAAAVALLVSSSRVMQDISHTMDHGQSGWNMSVVVRPWDSEALLEREFRAFVVEGRLTAVTQYDDQLRSNAVQQPEDVVSAILRTHARALPGLQRLGLTKSNTCVVVDFLLLPAEAWEARVIELNPFGPMTGASLFTWSGDRRLLQGGCDIYGDLEAWEQKHPPANFSLPPCVKQCFVDEVCFRYLTEDSPGVSNEQLEMIWSDYLRLAPPGLGGRS